MVRSLPSFRDVLKSLVSKTKVVALVVDLFGTDAFDVAKEFGVSPYIFFPSTAMALSLFLYLPVLDEMVSCEFRDLPEPLRIPGCIPIHGKELLDPVQDRKNDAYKWVLHHTKRYRLADGIMVNSFVDLESGAIKALLDQTEQATGVGFVRVVRERRDTVVEPDSRVGPGVGNKQATLLVGRFLERTRGRGLAVPSWAPQAQVLSHGSTGGFLTHCGWNSALESVANGVPLIAWPLYAEQKMNSVMLTEDIKVALRPKSNENGLVCRDEIAKAVKGLMEGEEGKGIRRRMKDLKEAAGKVLSENGCSTMALSEVATKWTNQASI
ncbi:Hydroquinone glucosyltransferase [Hibiscus syriacus]|uniref:Hydroquinone glucosyltransferase n=1 Tax=Hibiscus syriacus TaxID=106335 RepID=A0A6A3BZD3_HIBSY|nr:Hydroquinone glucosyltransferase [Hibiscus syriacus]